MNMTHFDSNPVPITYTNEELEIIIDDFIKENESFGFHELCNFIVEKAKKNKKVVNAQNTEYRSSELSPSYNSIISCILWNRIWNRKLIIEFGTNQYRSQYPGDTYFTKVIDKYLCHSNQI